MQLIDKIKAHTPFNDEEAASKASFLQLLDAHGDFAFDRGCLPGHITVSGWIVNQDNTKVLMAYHNMYKSYAWLGGHSDGNQDLRQVVTEEIQEESGLKDFTILGYSFIELSLHTVYYHIKRGIPTPTHLHYDVCFAVQANDRQPIRIKEDENSAIAWLDRETFTDHVTEKGKPEIYRRLQAKTDKLLGKV